MLTKLPNGNAIDLSKATAIYVNEEFNSWYVRSGNHVQFGKCDTFEQACQERDRLIDIASLHTSRVMLIGGRFYRASDVLSATTCGWDGSKWYIVVYIRSASGNEPTPLIVNCDDEHQGNALACGIMERVAGVAE